MNEEDIKEVREECGPEVAKVFELLSSEYVYGQPKHLVIYTLIRALQYMLEMECSLEQRAELAPVITETFSKYINETVN